MFITKRLSKKEAPVDTPTVTNNSDGTVILAHQDQTITAIFVDYIIYDFNQVDPNTNPEGEFYKN